MNLFDVLRGSYGQVCIKDFRRLEKLEKTRARFRNHLRFNLRCRDEEVTPQSLNIRNPIPTKNAEKIINKARKDLIKERIRITANKVDKINNQIKEETDMFKQRYPTDQKTQEQIKAQLKHAHEQEFITTKNRQLKKLKKLTERKNGRRQTHTEKNDKWVKNLSQRTLTDTEKTVLNRGLNFAITPARIPHEEYILATELACEKIQDQGEKAALRNAVAGILKTAKLPQSNVTRKEEKALNSLKTDKTITILPADKGRTTVILDTETYEKQMETMLADSNTYEIIKTNPTEEKKKMLKALLKPLLESNKITKDAYDHLIPTASITPRIYGTPKIHKKDIPLRPIIDSIGSVTYNLSKALAEIIKPLLGLSDFHCKNSKELAQELKDIKIESDEILISHDVISLFTKTPIDVTLHIVQERLNKDSTLKRRTNLTVHDISKLLQFVAKSTYFQFRGKIYKQKEGFAMGDPLSAIMSSFFMEDLENKAINTAPTICKPTLWKRYVDDILEKIRKGHTQELTDHLNSTDSTGNIKFTHEEEENGTIAFLDMKIHHNEDGSIKITVYRKPTHTDQYLLWTSEHPTAHKLSVVRTLYERATIITEQEDRQEEENHIKHALIRCQYPVWAINKGKQQVKNKENKQDTRHRTKAEIKNKETITIPYIRGITEPIQRIMKKYKINTAVKPHKKLRQLLVHPKDRIEQDNKCNVLYEISCRSCNKTYIGETGRLFTTRKKEHQKECEKETQGRLTRSQKEKAEQETLKSAISDHCKRNNHIMDWDNTKIIGSESNRHKRWIKEAIEIRKRGKDTMNRDEGAFMLSHTWDHILQRPSDGGRRGRLGGSDRSAELAPPTKIS